MVIFMSDNLLENKNPNEIKEKRKISKKKKEKNFLIEEILSNAKKLSKDECVLILSSIASGTTTDFTGLPPSLETRIKAIDKLMPLLENEPNGQLNSITVNIVDSTNDEKIEQMEKKILEMGDK